MRLPSGVYHENYTQDHAWWQTRFVWFRMLALFVILFAVFPSLVGGYELSVANRIGYTILSALGVQLLIGFAGQVTLGHMAFVAIGAYTSAIFTLNVNQTFPILKDLGLSYPISMIVAMIVAGLWSMLFGLPSARVKGFYLIMTTMAAQFITVDFIITHYISRVGDRGVSFSLPPGTIRFGLWDIRTDLEQYYLMLVLVILGIVFVGNLMRTRIGRAWIAIRDNDIAAEVLGVNVVRYKLLAFFVAGALAGLAGSYANAVSFTVSPEQFSFGESLWLVGVVLIGGIGSNYGTIYGAIYLTMIAELVQPALKIILPDLALKTSYVKDMVFGLSIVVFLLLEPKGLAYRWSRLKDYIHLWPFSY
ncbi:MAG: branched-chain amino acid ABC transporter permease [Chloroflexi bacterium]|nr:branched-chain amino acid ABC transporter permease [Chloroflexota bacterium]